MTKEQEIAPWNTAQLFRVTCRGDKKYILKEIKKEPWKEIGRLKDVCNYGRLAPYIDPKGKDNLKVNVPFAYVSYQDWNGRKRFLVIMREAKGILLQELMEEKFRKHPDSRKVKKELTQVYRDLGAALAGFYKTFVHSDFRTIVHGDLHTGNIFYDKDSRIITLIDNESIGRKLGKFEHMSDDLRFLFLRSLFVKKWALEDLGKKWSLVDIEKWYPIVIPSFFRGFIEKFPKHERTGWFYNLKDCLLLGKREYAREQKCIKKVLSILEQELLKKQSTKKQRGFRLKRGFRFKISLAGRNCIKVHDSNNSGRGHKEYWGRSGEWFGKVCFEDNGKILVAHLKGGGKRVWDSSNKDVHEWERAVLKPNKPDIIAVLDLSKDHIKVYRREHRGQSGNVKIYGGPEGKKIKRIEFSKDGKRLIGHLEGGGTRTWDSSDDSDYKNWGYTDFK